MMRKPQNTGTDTGGLEILLDAMTHGPEGVVERQEARGQTSFVNSDTLPTDIRDQHVLEEAGVKFLDVVEGDEIFQYVELPEGWKKEPTDHDMWSKLLDAEGNERASIFYKAASYDRTAFARVALPPFVSPE